MQAYLGKISRCLELDRYDKRNAEKRGGGEITLVLDELADCIPDNDNGMDVGESIELKDALNSFLWSLPLKTRNIFIRRYWYVSSISEIAKDYSMKESNVAMLMLRTRKQLKVYLSKEGFEI